MTSYNSKNAKAKKFNSNRLAAAEDSNPLKLLFARGSSGYSMFNHDPEYSWVRSRAANAADHYLNGCNCSTKGHCSGSYKDHGLKEPSEDAIHTLGLYKSGGQWRHDRSATRLGNTRTLGSYLQLPVSLKAWQNKTPKNMKMQDLVYNPLVHIGYDSVGDPRLSGHYDDSHGHVQFEHPFSILNDAKHLRDKAYSDLIFDKNSTNLKDYWDASKAVTHLIHGNREGSGYTGLQEGQKPLFLHTSLEGVLKNNANYSVPDLGAAKTSVQADSFKDLHRSAKTAKFVMCNCPACALDRWAHGSNQVFDVQDHMRAARSEDPALREAYFSDNAHHVNAVKFHGDDELVRLSDLGQTGKMTPHRTWWPTKYAHKFIDKAVQGMKDRKHVNYDGLSSVMPVGVKRFDEDIVKQLSGKNLLNELPSPYDED